MSNNSRLMKNTAIYAVGNLGSKVLSYVMVFVYSYYIKKEDMGYYDLILTTVTMMQPIVMIQINDGLYRFLIDGSQNERKKVLSTCFKVLTISVVIADIIFLAFSCWTQVQYRKLILLYFSSAVLYVAFHDSVRGLSNTKLYAGLGVLNSFVMLSFEIVGLVILKQGIGALLVSKTMANISCIVCAIIFEKELRLVFKEKIDKVLIKELMRYSAPLVPNTVCWWVVNSSDRYIILFFLGTAFNGIYSISNKFPSILTTLTAIFYLAWQESAIKEYDTPKRDAFFSGVFIKYYRLLFSLGACAIPATKIVTTLFIAQEYKTAWMYTGFLYLGAIFSALCSFLGLGYQISKETARSLATTVFAAFLNIIINVLLVKHIGLHAASVSTFLAYLFLFIIRIKHTKRYFNLSFNMIEVIEMMVGCLVLIGLSFIFDSMIALLLLSIFAFCAMLYVNKDLLRSLLKKLHLA